MKRKLYRELWSARFEKMLALEEKSLLEYQSILEVFRKLVKEHPFHTHIERLILDEEKHAKLVKQLMQILDSQDDSDEV